MRWWGDLDDGRAQLQTAPGGEVALAQVEIQVELVSGELPPVRPPGHQRRGSGVHHRELPLRVGPPVRAAATSSQPPAIAHKAFGTVQRGLREDLSVALGRTADDELNSTLVGR